MKVRLVITTLAALLGLACQEKPQRFSTQVEVMQVRTFGAATGPKMADVEVKYADCPADARQIMRLGKDFSECGQALEPGEKLPADVVLSWNSERRLYRSEVVRLGKCDVKLDAKDEANYQSVESCSDVKLTGVVVGVRCDRTRGPELVAKCPWLKR